MLSSSYKLCVIHCSGHASTRATSDAAVQTEPDMQAVSFANQPSEPKVVSFSEEVVDININDCDAPQSLNVTNCVEQLEAQDFPAAIVSVDSLIIRQIDVLREKLQCKWPPALHMTEDDGCANIMSMMEDSAKEIVEDAIGTLSADHAMLLTQKVRTLCAERFEVWKESSSAANARSSSAWRMASINNRGMAQPSKRQRKKG